MLENLEKKHVAFTLDEQPYTISLKNIAISSVVFGLAVSLVSVVIGGILSGFLSLINIIVSPLLVTYLVAELKDTIAPVFIEKMCINIEAETNEKQR